MLRDSSRCRRMHPACVFWPCFSDPMPAVSRHQMAFATSDKKVTGCCIEMNPSDSDKTSESATYFLFAGRYERDRCPCRMSAPAIATITAYRPRHCMPECQRHPRLEPALPQAHAALWADLSSPLMLSGAAFRTHPCCCTTNDRIQQQSYWAFPACNGTQQLDDDALVRKADCHHRGSV